MKKKLICLNMIVKDECEVICRCLQSVKNLIDYWVIVDTGSTDGTQEIIKDFLRDIPGELHENPWVDFAHNRNIALRLAKNKGDYLLFIDADDQLICPPGWALPQLTKDCYYVNQKVYHDNVYSLNRSFFLIKNLSDFSWVGTIHETLSCQTPKTTELLSEIIIEYMEEGNRSKNEDKLASDIQILEKSLQENPFDSRTTFYLAKAYLANNENAKALQMFTKRSTMKGCLDERFFSLYCIAFLQKHFQKSAEVFIKSYSDAFLADPSRIEPLYDMAEYFIENENYLSGYLISKKALAIIDQKKYLGKIFIDSWKYDGGVLQQYNICALYLGLS